MEEQNNIDKKKKRKKIIFFGLGISAAGLLTFFGIDQYKKWKNNKKSGGDTNTDAELPDNNTPAPSLLPPAPTSTYTKPNVSDEFPLKKGSKGDKVKQLQ